MIPVHLFDLISQHNNWLSVRQSAIAGNVANANTPGYKAVDTAAFESALNSARLNMAATNAGHMSSSERGSPVTDVSEDGAWEIVHSGNSVSLEQEMVKAGEVHRSFAMNSGVLKAFHRMLMASTKG